LVQDSVPGLIVRIQGHDSDLRPGFKIKLPGQVSRSGFRVSIPV